MYLDKYLDYLSFEKILYQPLESYKNDIRVS